MSAEDQSEMLNTSEIIGVIINEGLVFTQSNSLSLMISTTVTDLYRQVVLSSNSGNKTMHKDQSREWIMN